MTNAPVSNRNRLLAMLGIFALALVGVGFLVTAVFLLVRGSGGIGAPAAGPTRIGLAASQVVFVPTTTQSPPTETLAPTVAPAAITPTTSAAPSEPPAASATAAHLVTITRPANVRTGPGLTYPAVGGLNTGQTAPAIGRDSSSQWFAISFNGAPQGTGWVSSLVATLDGSVSDLPVIQAAAPPATAVPPTSVAATGTAAPPAATNTQNVQGAGGLHTISFKMEKTTGATGESMWFDFSVVNSTGSDISFGLLAAHTDAGVTASSWSSPIKAGKQLDWRDHINFGTAGTYQVYLGICYDSINTCQTGGTWVKLSNSTAVTIQ